MYYIIGDGEKVQWFIETYENSHGNTVLWGRTVQIQKVIVQQFVTQSPSVTFEFVTISNVTICYTFCDAPIVKSKLSQSVHPKYAGIHRSNIVLQLTSGYATGYKNQMQNEWKK